MGNKAFLKILFVNRKFLNQKFVIGFPNPIDIYEKAPKGAKTCFKKCITALKRTRGHKLLPS
jgi:hypothetical protein